MLIDKKCHISIYKEIIIVFGSCQKMRPQSQRDCFLLRGWYGDLSQKEYFFFIFAKCSSHYARLICKVLRGQD